VCHPSQDVLAGSISLRQGDEGPARVVDTPGPQSERRQILVELFQHAEILEIQPVHRGRADEVFRRGSPAEGPSPSLGLPGGQDARERRVYGDHARLLRLHAFLAVLLAVVAGRDQQPAERHLRRIPVLPTPRGPFTDAAPGQEDAGVKDAAVFRKPCVRDELFHLLMGEDRACAPRGVLVDLLGQLAALERARVDLDQLVRHRILEEEMKRPVDVPHRARGELAFLAPHLRLQLLHQGADMLRPDLAKHQLSEDGHRVKPQPRFIVLGTRKSLSAAVVRPPLEVALDGDGPKLGFAELLPGLHAPLDHLEELLGLVLLAGGEVGAGVGPFAAGVLVSNPETIASGVDCSHVSYPPSRKVAPPLTLGDPLATPGGWSRRHHPHSGR